MKMETGKFPFIKTWWNYILFQVLQIMIYRSKTDHYLIQKKKKSVKVIALSLWFLMHQRTTKLKTGIMWVIEA